MTLRIVRIYPKNRLLAWIEDRLPVFSFLAAHTTRYYSPKNFNIWYLFGALAGWRWSTSWSRASSSRCKPSAAEAFSSVEYIMRGVSWAG
jgi:ubiquinol-cytochrome c reductase cytochrome b subunit